MAFPIAVIKVVHVFTGFWFVGGILARTVTQLRVERATGARSNWLLVALVLYLSIMASRLSFVGAARHRADHLADGRQALLTSMEASPP
jgi:hypothetical protein